MPFLWHRHIVHIPTSFPCPTLTLDVQRGFAMRLLASIPVQQSNSIPFLAAHTTSSPPLKSSQSRQRVRAMLSPLAR
jgi:hypothetical protein